MSRLAGPGEAARGLHGKRGVQFRFVTFRIFAGVAQASGVGTLQEQLAAASWFCWAVPLLVTEAVLQGKKIFAA